MIQKTDHDPATEHGQIPGLVSRLRSKHGEERHHARLGLVRLGDAAVPFLAVLLEDDRWRVRREAAKALAAIASPATTDPLIRALHDESSSVRWVAAEGLVGLGPCALEGLLRELIHHGSSLRFRSAAHHVLIEEQEGPVGNILAPVLEALGRSSADGDRILAAHRSLDRLHAWCAKG